MKDCKSWLGRLPETFQKLTTNSIRTAKQFTNKYKKTIGTSLCAVALLTGVHNDSVKANGHSELNLDTIYHVYIDGERIGSVDNQQPVERLINNLIEKSSDDYDDLQLVVGEDLDLIPEVVFSSRANNSKTIEKLEHKLTIQAEAVALKVDGEEISYVRTMEDFKEVIEKLKLQYVTEEELSAVRKAQQQNEVFDELKVGEKLILDVKLSKEVETAKVAAKPEKVLSIKDAVKQLNLGTLEDDIYIVEPGDVLGSIAVDHDLSLQEILELNTSITEDTLLQIGDELNVTVYEPAVKVIVEETSKVKEEIPFQTKTEDDANMWRGDTKVQQSGQKGERVVSYNITRENGRTVQREIISENITKEPVDRVVLRGTKVSPSRGTGQLAWPAVGGYVSSPMGMRWGRMHNGIDIARPTNRNILAADNGTVSFAGWSGGYGNTIRINHNNGMTTLYAHLSSIDVRVGQTVGKGQKIGVMGSTGNSTGVHLHFEVYQNGQLRNPMDFFNR